VLLAVLCLCWGSSSIARGQHLKLSTDSSAYHPGSPVRVSIEAYFHGDPLSQWPQWTDSLRGWEVLRLQDVQRRRVNDSLRIRQQALLMAFDTGTYRLPGLRFVYQQADSAAPDTLRSEALSLPIRYMAVDTAEAMTDIDPPLPLPYTWADYKPYVIWGGAGLLLALLGLLLYHRYGRKRPEEPAPVTAGEPVEQSILHRLREMEHLRHWESAPPKAFYLELTHLLRRYMEIRTGIRALEMTSEELLEAFSAQFGHQDRYFLSELFRTADLAKFARHNPPLSDGQRYLRAVIEWIEAREAERRTAPAEQAPQTAAHPTNAQ
jgi:hypothetical protein